MHLLALQTYHRIYGHVVVPKDFIIPEYDNQWPQDSYWTKKLGNVVSSFRARLEKLSNKQVDTLNQLGFVWDAHEYEWQINLKALQTCHLMHGHVLVPYHFTVPEHDNQWPQECWNKRLGDLVQYFRARVDNLSKKQVDALNQLDFVWDARDHQWQINLKALQTYS
ncbi:Aste57867_11763 [Aphanomyces stellatus]|uniref:Aste57867_11763 protein n=1 Tax=Aphanomyces stellatus TaxID=120398 RepID=A0A485KUB4_9STRA|nr:hypothetical protein As57867_011718 [Aphanomyces stellatus]VFT88619.1 Aste57867_11763 [Aphanomyces stellatus]